MAIRDKNFRYEVDKFQGLIQQILSLTTRGYTRIHVTYYPRNKKDKWQQIDTKIYRRYQANITRGQIDYRRKKGYKVYKFFRWENVMIIMSTAGNDFPEIEEDDNFLDLKTGQQKVKIGEHLTFIIYVDERKKITARVGKNTLDYWSQNIQYHAQLKHKKALQQEIYKINLIPPWRGVHLQKKEIRKFIISEIKRNGVHYSKKEIKNIRFNTRRKQIKVFK